MSLPAEPSRSRSPGAQSLPASKTPEIRPNTSLALETWELHPHVLPESSGEVPLESQSTAQAMGSRLTAHPRWAGGDCGLSLLWTEPTTEKPHRSLSPPRAVPTCATQVSSTAASSGLFLSKPSCHNSSLLRGVAASNCLLAQIAWQ